MRVIPGTGSRHGKEGANGWITDFVRKDFPRQAENLILAEIEDKEGQEQFRVSVKKPVQTRQKSQQGAERLRSRPRSRDEKEIKAQEAATRPPSGGLRLESGPSRESPGRLCGSPTEGSHSAVDQPVQNDRVPFLL